MEIESPFFNILYFLCTVVVIRDLDFKKKQKRI